MRKGFIIFVILRIDKHLTGINTQYSQIRYLESSHKNSWSQFSNYVTKIGNPNLCQHCFPRAVKWLCKSAKKEIHLHKIPTKILMFSYTENRVDIDRVKNPVSSQDRSRIIGSEKALCQFFWGLKIVDLEKYKEKINR